MKKNSALLLFVLSGLAMLLSCISSYGQAIRLQKNNWYKAFNATDLSLSGEAGSDYNPTLETSANFNQLDIRNVGDARNWKVTVSKRDINWPGTFVPYVIRNSNGAPCPSCAGVNNGSSISGYLQITNIEQDFIFGAGRVDNIDLQFKIEGISLAAGAQNYQTEIIFTLYGD